MSFGRLGALMIALAVLFAPALTHAGAAFAAMPSHDMQIMEAGHCQAPPSQSGHHDKDGKSCCISLTIGVAACPSAPVGAAIVLGSPPVFRLATLHRPYLGELATPPPRPA
ncbi:MAG TPA: hypothetical protein VGQ34_08135 [Sphingomicrobium sp.]|jgi:hypothetical protein|nr:hypothetical protein [Sphingomicrobium sp.]